MVPVRNYLTTNVRYRIILFMNRVHEEIKQAYSSVGGIDLARLSGVLDTDVVLHVPGDHPLAGDHQGLDQIHGFVQASRDATSDGEHVERIDTLVGESHVGVLVRVTAARPDRDDLINHTIHLFALDDDAVTDIWFHNRDQAAVDAFWS